LTSHLKNRNRIRSGRKSAMVKLCYSIGFTSSRRSRCSGVDGPTPRNAEGHPPAAGPIAADDSFVHYDSPMNFMYQTYNMSTMGPPWSTLTAYDLNTGTIKWQVPNGGITELEQQGHTDTGARLPRGGPVVTAGWLIFAATASDHKVRAYDQDTGKVFGPTICPPARTECRRSMRSAGASTSRSASPAATATKPRASRQAPPSR